jgi:ribose transport system substrate-binding protein
MRARSPLHLGILLAGLAGAVPAGAAPTPTFVMIPKSSSLYYGPCFDGFSAAAAKYGIEVQRLDPAKADAALQAAVIDQVRARKVDGIAVSAVDDAGVSPAIAAATKAGIPVITFDSPAPSSPALTYIGTDNRAAGLEAGKRLVAAMRGTGSVLVLQGGMAAANLNQRAAGLKEGLRTAPGVKLLDVVDISGDAAAAAGRVETALREHPTATAVFSVSSAGTPAAVATLEKQGRAGKVLVAGFDDLPATLDGIRRGAVSFCVVQKTFKMGWLSVRALLMASAGKKPPRSVDTGVVFVTAANVATYVDEMRSEVTRGKKK